MDTVYIVDYTFVLLFHINCFIVSLQCFDAVDWAAGRASSL